MGWVAGSHSLPHLKSAFFTYFLPEVKGCRDAQQQVPVGEAILQQFSGSFLLFSERLRGPARVPPWNPFVSKKK